MLITATMKTPSELVFVQLRLNPEARRQLNILAAEHGQTQSEVVASLIEKHMRALAAASASTPVSPAYPGARKT